MNDPANVYVVPSTGKRRCRKCTRIVKKAHHDRKTVGKAGHIHITSDECIACGRPKFRDRRKLCFGCSMVGKVSKSVCAERMVSDAVALETAPEWVKREGGREHRRWLDARKHDLMRVR
jgi:hypothetical protein